MAQARTAARTAASPLAGNADERRLWSTATAVAVGAHLAAAVLVLSWARPAELPQPEPVVMVELPPIGAPDAPELLPVAQPLPTPQQAANPAPAQPLQQPALPVPVPVVRAPVPVSAALPPQPVAAAVAAQPAVQAPAAPTRAAAAPASAGSTDPRARQQEIDYFALVSAHLNRRKIYPVEARQARQQGVVTVRFTVDRGGNVSNVSIKRSSGYDVLDAATLSLVQRVAPLPRMPSAMARDSITLSLPIDYSLRTS